MKRFGLAGFIVLMVWLAVAASPRHVWLSEVRRQAEGAPETQGIPIVLACPDYYTVGQVNPGPSAPPAGDASAAAPPAPPAQQVTIRNRGPQYLNAQFDVCLLHGELRVLKADLPAVNFHCPR